MVEQLISKNGVVNLIIQGVEVNISSDCITIRNSSKIKDKKSMETILKIARNIARKNGYFYKRTNKSWIQEWQSHNLLYKYNLYKEHTFDTDLSENESKFRLFCYMILGR